MGSRSRSAGAKLALLLGLAALAPSPSVGQPRSASAYRCTFELEAPTPRSLVVVATCEVCSRGESERCGPASLRRPAAWVTTAAANGTERRLRARAHGRPYDVGVHEVQLRFSSALAPGNYTLHFAPERGADFRERFELDAAHHVVRRP